MIQQNPGLQTTHWNCTSRRDEALKTLAQTKQFEDQLRAKLHEKRLVSVRENFISEIDRLEHQIEIAERDLFFELTTILGHRPTTEELQTIVDLPTAIENETARRRILDSHKRVKIPVPKTPSEIAEEEDFAKWVAGLPTKPTAPSQTEKDAKEREEYRGYRALIERVERGYKK